MLEPINRPQAKFNSSVAMASRTTDYGIAIGEDFGAYWKESRPESTRKRISYFLNEYFFGVFFVTAISIYMLLSRSGSNGVIDGGRLPIGLGISPATV